MRERGNMNVVLSALATANPGRYATQEEIYAFLAAHFEMQPAEKELYRQLLMEGQIRGRHIAVDVDEEICSQDPDHLIRRFATHSRRIGAEAARTALQQAALEPADIDGLVVNTCTGYLCPGLSSYLVEDLGLGAFTSVLDLMGMGCGGAVPNLEAAGRMIQSGAKKAVLCVSVEICSATFFLGPDPDLIVSNSIFADGASAAILRADLNEDSPAGTSTRSVPPGFAGPTEPSPRPEALRLPPASGPIARFVDFESVTLPRYREQLRYTTEGGRLRNVLTRNVPVIGARAVGQVVQRLLDRHGLAQEAIDWWVVHPGGTQVLNAVQRQVALAPERLRFSYEVFREYGNMSSPSVMFVLDRILREVRPKPHETGLLLSFGAGFTAFAALVEFL
jgi:predicted naringenin-chalcone synthase